MSTRCRMRGLFWILWACAAVDPLLARDGDILFTVRVHRAGATLREGPSYQPSADGALSVGDVFTVEDYVAPYFRVSPGEHDEHDYFLRSADVEPVDSRPATVRKRTPLLRSMAVRREIISYLDKGTRLDVLGEVPDLDACLVRTKAAVFGWVSCAAVDLTFDRKGCYRLTDELDSVEITVQPGTTLTALAADTALALEDVRKACNTAGDRLLAGSRCRFKLPFQRPRLYVVQKGDTLTSIAQMGNLSSDALRRWNCLPGTTLQPGQRLLVLTYY